MAKIQSLPNEVLLEIALRLYGRHRNSDLASLSLVSQQFRPVAQETLLQKPCFKLANIHKFLMEMFREDWVIPKIQSLELWSTHEGRGSKYRTQDSFPHLGNQRLWHLLLMHPRYTAVPCPPDLRVELFFPGWKDTIKRFSKDQEGEMSWLKAFDNDVVPALLGLLLASLPNLKELRCAALWLMDFPIMHGLLSKEVTRTAPSRWRHRFLAGLVDKLASNLRVLEVPTNMTSMFFDYRPSGVFDYTSFRNLKELSVSMELIYYDQRNPPSPWPIPLLPPNLQLLRISEGTVSTVRFLEDLCKVKRGGNNMQSLKRVEVIYATVYENIVRYPKIVSWLPVVKVLPDPIHYMRSLFSDAELSLSLYFPGVPMTSFDADRSLWSLKESGELMDVEWKAYCKVIKFDCSKAYDWMLPAAMEHFHKRRSQDCEIFETSFDEQGDVKMRDC